MGSRFSFTLDIVGTTLYFNLISRNTYMEQGRLPKAHTTFFPINTVQIFLCQKSFFLHTTPQVSKLAFCRRPLWTQIALDTPLSTYSSYCLHLLQASFCIEPSRALHAVLHAPQPQSELFVDAPFGHTCPSIQPSSHHILILAAAISYQPLFCIEPFKLAF